MSEFYRAKFNELFTEFTRYLITHPDFGEDIPKGAEVILLDRQDPGYTNYMLERAPKKDAVFIDVGKFGPHSFPTQEAKNHFTPSCHVRWINQISPC